MLKLKSCSEQKFFAYIQEKNLYCFGAGKIAKEFWSSNSARNYIPNIVAFIDNDTAKSGQVVELEEYKVPVMSFEEFVNKQKEENICILITSIYFCEMIEQLNQEETLQNMECFISEFLTSDITPDEVGLSNSNEYKIPAKIHYCWFGKSSIPDKFLEYINTWRKYCPEYEIVRWDESNYDVTKNEYMHQAYNAKKWGFVPDFARLDIIYNEGGIYLDTDVEVIKNFNPLRGNEMFCGFETKIYVTLGSGFGAVKGNAVIKELRDFYNDKEFINRDGTYNMIPSPKYQTEVMKKLGFRMDGSYQNSNGIAIYPQEFFSPLSFLSNYNKMTNNTFSIHHYAATWFSDDKLKARKDRYEKIEMIKSKIEMF